MKTDRPHFDTVISLKSGKTWRITADRSHQSQGMVSFFFEDKHVVAEIPIDSIDIIIYDEDNVVDLLEEGHAKSRSRH